MWMCVFLCVTLCFFRSASPAVQVTLRPRPAMPLALLCPMSFLLLQAPANPITVQTTWPRVSHRSATSFSSVCMRDCHISCFITQFCVFLTCAWWIRCKSMKRCWFDFKWCTVGWFICLLWLLLCPLNVNCLSLITALISIWPNMETHFQKCSEWNVFVL